MKIEVRGSTEKLRRLQSVLESRFKGVEFCTGFVDLLIVEVFSTVSDCDRVKDFIDAYCVGAGTVWQMSQ